MKVGYLMTVFPNQAHLWYWREIQCMRQWGVPLQSYATRPPPPADRAKHAWAEGAAAETTYLWPMGKLAVLGYLLANFFRSPIGFVRCVWLGLTINVDSTQRPRWKHTLPLVILACKMASLVRKDGLTHIHSHTAAKGAIICMMVNRLTGIKWSMVVNAHIDWWGGAMIQKFKEAGHTFFVTQWMVDEMVRDYPMIPRDKYSLGRVGVDCKKWQRSATPKAENAVPQVIAVGRLVTSKGHHLVTQAMRILKDRGLQAHFKIGGEGPERPRLEALIKELDVADRVELLGNLSEERYLAEMDKADIFILASNEEPMGVVYMEAQAMEVPTIGTNRGGPLELIKDGVTGMLIPPQNPEAIADALAKLIADPDLRQRMGKAGRQNALENFDSRIWAARVYKHIVGHEPPAEVDATVPVETAPVQREPVGV
ncbi:MAG TPA: glycosyltransferase [Tepidisphaeraceae bacterium]|nr:glycosyltransferase [Tepidisphaeraceae bacterium]